LTPRSRSESVASVNKRAFLAAAAAAATTGMAAQARAAQRPAWVPAPPKYSVVYDNPQNAGGVDPTTGQPYPAVGQYADTNTNTVHTTRGYGKRAIAQDVGQIFGHNVLDSGQQAFFTKLLLGTNHPWENPQGAQPEGMAAATGDEAFADYYALAATGGLQRGQSLAWGDVSIDRRKLKLFGAALRRLGSRQHLSRYTP
jgi:hypothetical protein